jgi:hypothetical protein
MNLPIQYTESSDNNKQLGGLGWEKFQMKQIKMAQQIKENNNDVVNRNEMIDMQQVHGLDDDNSNNKHISLSI